MKSFQSYAWIMQVELTPEQESFIELGIVQGRYRVPEEAVQQALAQWVERERKRVELLASLDDRGPLLEAGNVKSPSSDAATVSEVRHIEAGMAELRAGKGIPHERVAEWLDSWGTANELSAPR